MKATAVVTEDPVPLSPRTRFRVAMILAMAADGLQIFVFPLFAEGALSPADDVLDIAVAAALVQLLGWHWEFLPAFLAELVPGVDLVPFWTMAVANVYRKWKQIAVTAEEAREQRPALEGHTKFVVTRESDRATWGFMPRSRIAIRARPLDPPAPARCCCSSGRRTFRTWQRVCFDATLLPPFPGSYLAAVTDFTEMVSPLAVPVTLA